MKKILVVEDDLGTMKTVKFLLDDYYTVETVSNGKEALEWLGNHKPIDLVLTDLEMPEMNGLELIQAMDGSFAYEQIPVVIMSSDCGQWLDHSPILPNVFGCLDKPVVPAELYLKLEEAFFAQLN